MKPLVVLILLSSSIAFASPKHTKTQLTWWCFIAVDSNTQTVEGCERSETACNEDIAMHELNADKVHCYGSTKAAVFVLAHKNDGRQETIAVPEVRACQYISQAMINEDIDLVVPCKVIP